MIGHVDKKKATDPNDRNEAVEWPTFSSDPAAYRPSHRSILRPIEKSAAASSTIVVDLGAVVVPTNRSFNDKLPGLELAARLATHRGSFLIVLCSGTARSDEFPEPLRRELGGNLVLWDLPGPKESLLPQLETSLHKLSTLWRDNDVGIKRNIGLALAVRKGWECVLFLDDDISTYEHGPTLDEQGLDSALIAMQGEKSLRAIGWTAEDFSDNSVIGHARRLVHRDQGIFISGGALLVRCDTDVPFFPAVYNEDWLFLIATATQATSNYRQCLAHAGRVRQRPNDPFSVARAKSQEAGDILGEGLMNLLEDDGPGLWRTATSTKYWRRTVRRRAALIKEIVGALDSDLARPSKLGARTAMEAALRVNWGIPPKLLTSYVKDWKADLDKWHKHLAVLAGLEVGSHVGQPGTAARA
jgi:hypothetical protein